MSTNEPHFFHHLPRTAPLLRLYAFFASLARLEGDAALAARIREMDIQE